MRQLWIFCHFVGLNEELVMDTTTFFTHSWFTPGYGKYSGCCFLHSEGLRQGRAGLYPVLFCQPSPSTASGSFSGFLYLSSPLSLCGISPTLMHRCSTLIPLPLRHIFMIQGSKGQPCPMLALSYREQQKDALQTYSAKLSIIH